MIHINGGAPVFRHNLTMTMANKHRLAGLIWATILVIAVQFVPNAAMAHSGHQHMAASEPGATSQTIVPVQGIAARDAVADVAKPKAPASQLAASDKRDHASRPSTGCVGGCCGSGLGCCSAAALPGSGQALPQFDTRAEIVAFDVGIPSVIDFETLARPPKLVA